VLDVVLWVAPQEVPGPAQLPSWQTPAWPKLAEEISNAPAKAAAVCHQRERRGEFEFLQFMFIGFWLEEREMNGGFRSAKTLVRLLPGVQGPLRSMQAGRERVTALWGLGGACGAG